MITDIVVSCFDYTGNMVKPWADAGYICYCVDLRHKPGEYFENNIVWVGGDVMKWEPPRTVEIAFFFPPCTDIALSGARWFRGKSLPKLIEALQLFQRCIEIAELSGAPYMIENPASMVSTYYRKPDCKFQPWQYGEDYSKETWLWIGGGFRMPKPSVHFKPESVKPKIHLMTPSKDRGYKRSETPIKFAQAVYEANKDPNISVVHK